MKAMIKILLILFFASPLLAYDVLGLGVPYKSENVTFTHGPASNTIKGLNALGISCALFEQEPLNAASFSGVKIAHLEGFRLIKGAYMEKAMDLAKKAGAKISLDLASSLIASKFRERILALLETYTDILFVNEEEAFALTQMPPEKAAFFLTNFCPVVVVKVGQEGCWVSSSEGLFHSPAAPNTSLDFTEAGDLFASAFLYGYLNGNTLKECAYFGNLAWSAAVEKGGAELPLSTWEELRQKISMAR